MLVLTSLTLMTILLTSVQDETSAELGDAVTSRDALKAEYAAKSAINLSRLLISAEQPVVRPALSMIGMMLGRKKMGQIPIWEHAPALLGAFNDDSSVQSFASMAGFSIDEAKNLGLEGARFEVNVVDEDSKINVNLAGRNLPRYKQQLAIKLAGLMGGTQYDALFEQPDANDQFTNQQAICSALVDWVDSDMEEYPCEFSSAQSGGYAGAEDAFYQLLEPPYVRKNASLDSVEELRMIRGMGDDFWATFVEPDPWNPESRTLTVWGQGKVNVNTANPQTILAAVYGEICLDENATDPQPLCIDPMQSQYLYGMLAMIKSLARGVPFFAHPKNFIHAISGKGKALGSQFKMLAEMMYPEFVFPVFKSVAQATEALTTTSEVFTIQATGIAQSGKRETRRRITAVIDFRGAPQAVPVLTPEQQQQQLANAGADELDSTNFYKPTPGGNIIYYRVD